MNPPNYEYTSTNIQYTFTSVYSLCLQYDKINADMEHTCVSVINPYQWSFAKWSIE